MTAAHIIIGEGGGSAGDATSIQGVTVSATPPTDGQVLTYNNGTGEWEPDNPTGGSGTPGGSDTQIQFNDGGSFGGDAGLTYNKTTNVVSVSDALAIGATPSTTGAIRLASGALIAARDNAGTGVVNMITTDASDNLVIGATNAGAINNINNTFVYAANTIYQAIGGSARHTVTGTLTTSVNDFAVGANPASAGAIRLANTAIISVRNAANSADVQLAQVTSGNNILIGHASNPADIYVRSGSGRVNYYEADTHGFRTAAGADVLSFTSTLVSFSPSLAIGANPATAGVLRIGNGTAIKMRNVSNNADILVIGNSGSTNDVLVGDSNAATVKILPATDVWLGSSTATSLIADSTSVTMWQGVLKTASANVASAGNIRMANTQYISARNGGNTDNMTIAGVDASDNLVIGANPTSQAVGALNHTLYFTGTAHVLYKSSTELGRLGNANTDHVSFGAAPATGTTNRPLRLSNDMFMTMRNAANSGNMFVIGGNASDQIIVGGASNPAGTFVYGNGEVSLAAADVRLYDASSNLILETDTNQVTINRPITQTRTTNASTGTLNDVSIGNNLHIHFTNATGPTVNGFTGGIAGRMLFVTFTAAGVIAHEAAGSTAANRVDVGSGVDIAVGAGETIQFIYDAANSRWLPVGAAI